MSAATVTFVCVCESLSCVRLFVTPWTVAHQAPVSLELSSQEYWSGLPYFPHFLLRFKALEFYWPYKAPIEIMS